MNKSWTNCEQIVNILWTNCERVRQYAQKTNKCSIDYCTYCTNAGNIWKFIEQMFSSKWRTRTSVLVKLHKLIEQMFVNSEYCRKYDVDFVHIDCGKLCGKCWKNLSRWNIEQNLVVIFVQNDERFSRQDFLFWENFLGG